MEIQTNEFEIIGHWIMVDKKVVGDETSKRIEFLRNNYLEKIAAGNWEVLYQDPNDKRYWELTYPNGEYQGGGPSSLTNISREIAIIKYGIER